MNKIIKRGIATVSVILSAFGSAGLKIQPPGDGTQKSIGFIVSFSLLLILLIIAAIADYFQFSKMRLVWIGLALISLMVFIFLSFSYSGLKQKYVVAYPADTSASYNVGSRLDSAGLQTQRYLVNSSKSVNNYNLIKFGGSQDNIHNIWQQDSINEVTSKLIQAYVWLMVCLTAGIFSITEGALKSKTSTKQKTTKPERTQ